MTNAEIAEYLRSEEFLERLALVTAAVNGGAVTDAAEVAHNLGIPLETFTALAIVQGILDDGGKFILTRLPNKADMN
jgi:hypothetical protein